MSSSGSDRRSRRQARREEARRAEATASRNRWLIPGLLSAVIIAAAAIAILLPGAGGQAGGGSSTLPPSTATDGSQAASSRAPVVTGNPLLAFDNPNEDPAIGLPAPEVAGADFDGKLVEIAHDGRAKAILFITHWCPHCQDEVPLIQAWVNAGGVPSDLDLISVVTSIDPSRPNYPPDAWLQREGWTVPVIVDPTNEVANAYGLTAFPFWVFVGADGNVQARAIGELPIANLEEVLRRLRASPT